MDVAIGKRTDTGKRANNEDCLRVVRSSDFAMSADALVVVADGMGGCAHGEQASALAARTIEWSVRTQLIPGLNCPPYRDILTEAIRRANGEVYELSQQAPEDRGMGTTCVVGIFALRGVVIAHVGDSRAYLVRDERLERLTCDHSLVEDQIKTGKMSDHDARGSTQRHLLTRAVGVRPGISPVITYYDLNDGDSVLFCTDGLSNHVDEIGIVQIIMRSGSAQQAVDNLVDAAIMSGSNDNVTAVLASVSSVASADAQSAGFACRNASPLRPGV